MTTSINWSNFKNNIQSQELSFESFVNQIIRNKYSSFGFIEDYYNTPGSEIYLTLNKDCEELNLKKGDIVGWQVKFWLNHNDDNNSKLDSKNRNELIDNFKTTLKYKNNIKKWIVCTPGKFSNTKNKAGKPFDILVAELLKIKKDVMIEHWHKELYEKFYHDNLYKLGPIMSHYFGLRFIGKEVINNYTKNKIDYLQKKFDSDLYVPNEADEKIFSLIKYNTNLDLIRRKTKNLKNEIKKIKKSEFYNFDNFKKYKLVYIQKAKELLDRRILTVEYVIKTIEGFDYLNFDISNKIFSRIGNDENDNSKTINALNTLVKNKKHVNETKNTDYNINEENAHDFYIKNINFIGAELFGKKDDNHNTFDVKVIDLIEQLTFGFIPVFGDAGDGKTNLACSVCKNLVDEGLPALLILASELSSSRDIKEQLLSLLDIPKDFTFRDFLGSLNNLGFANKIKIPIIIDGLNETCPTAHVWKAQIIDLMGTVNEFENILLIITCRDRYVKQIFEKESYRDVENHLHISGFTKNNIDEVIDKYFSKYRIKVKNSNFDKKLLQKPIILKIFSIINKDQKVSVTPSNIYQVIEEYFNKCIEKISTKDGVLNTLLEKEIKKRLESFSQKIWDINTRSLKYPEDFIKIFDPSYSDKDDFPDTISYKILDEGVFVSRGMKDKDEYVEFCYDLLGGYYIAKSIFFNEKDPIKAIVSKNFLEKLINKNQGKNHPLREDIIRAVSYLLPEKTGKQIFEVINDDKILQDSISMIDLITDTKNGKKSFFDMINKIDLEDKNIDYLLEIVVSKTIENDDNKNVDLIVNILLKMNPVQIDLKWSELLRKRKWDLLKFLNSKINYTEDQPQTKNDLFCFIALVGTSPDKILRDTSTKALVVLGEKNTKELFKSLKLLSNFRDLYVIERLLCALLGVVVNINDKDLVFEICEYIENDLIKKLKTSHVLILDYSYMILEYAEKNYGREKNINDFYSYKNENWEEDEECRKKIDGDGKATWGYGPIDMDFAKYKIGFVASREHYSLEDSKTPTLKECLAMVIWKMKKNGYKKEIINNLHKKIFEESEKLHIRNDINYGEKYALIAFYEMCGYFILNDLIEPNYVNGFRMTNLDIDPTFPILKKRQLVTECYYPPQKEKIEKWIEEDVMYFKDYYSLKYNNSDWILLNANLNQENSEIDIRMNANLNTYFVNKNNSSEFVSFAKNDHKEISLFDMRMPERHHMFLGEASWSDNIPDGFEIIDIKNKNLVIYHPCFWYNCEESRSEINSFGYLPILNRHMVDELKLKFKPNTLSYFQGNQEAVKYIFDDYSHFLFIKKEILLPFFKKNNYLLMFYEYGSRYANWKNFEKNKTNKNFKDFKNISWLKL